MGTEDGLFSQGRTGVRVRASSRGVRTSIGPRAARVHVGSGRPGVSTGVGPVGYYTSVGGGSRPRSSSTRSTGTAAANRQLAAAAKLEQAQQLQDALRQILELPTTSFPAAQPRVAPEPPPVDRAAIRRRHRKDARSRTSVFDRAARKTALAEAEQQASAEVDATQRLYAEQRAAWQQDLDQRWKQLLANHPETLLSALAEAFEDNEAAAAAVGVDGSEASLLVIVPGPEALPERRPTTTAAGNLSLKKFTKRETADLYKLLVSGHVLVTLKEAFAVAPSLTAARIVALRAGPTDAYGRRRPEIVLAAKVGRSRLHGIQWEQADATQILSDSSTELLIVQKGQTKELRPIPLDEHPALRDLVAAVDYEELANNDVANTAAGGGRS